MAYNYEYPYTDPNRYNADWLLHTVKELQEKIGLYPILDGIAINVRDHGAKGNGFDDDIVAFEKSIAIAREKRIAVYVPTGIYKISRTLYIPEDITIVGNGKGKTIIQPRNSLNHLCQISGYTDDNIQMQNIVISGITFDAMGNSTGGHVLSAYGLKNVLINNCEFKNGYEYGLGLQGEPGRESPKLRGITENVIITNCDFIDCGVGRSGDGLDCKHAKDVTITRCRFIGNGDHGLDIRCTGGVTVSDCSTERNTAAGFSFRSIGQLVCSNCCSKEEAIGMVLSIEMDDTLGIAYYNLATVSNYVANYCTSGMLVKGAMGNISGFGITISNIVVRAINGYGITVEDADYPIFFNNIHLTSNSRNSGTGFINGNSSITWVNGGTIQRYLYSTLNNGTGQLKLNTVARESGAGADNPDGTPATILVEA